MASLDITRRALIGAMAVSPAIALPVSPAMARDSEWTTAAGAFDNADRAMRTYERDHYAPAMERYVAWREQWPMRTAIADIPGSKAALAQIDPIEARYNTLFSARRGAALALLAAPAPDVLAIARKVEVAIAEEEWDCEGFGDVMKCLLADLRRIG